MLHSVELEGKNSADNLSSKRSFAAQVGRRGSLWFRSEEHPEYEAIATDFPTYFQPGAFFPDWSVFSLNKCAV